MSFANTTRKALLGLLAIAAIGYGARLYARQQNSTGLTPPPKATSSKPSKDNDTSNVESPLIVGERLVYNIAWASFPSAASAEMEISAQGQFYGKDCYQLRSKVETLGQAKALFGDVENQYTSYVDMRDAVPYRAVSAAHSGQKASEEIVVFDHPRQKAVFSDDSSISIHGDTFDLTSLIYWLRVQPLLEGSRYKITALFGKELIEVEAVVKGRERLTVQAGAYSAILINFYPKGKYSSYRGGVYISADSQRLPVMIKANLPVGEARAELASVTYSSPKQSFAKLDSPIAPTATEGGERPPISGSKPGVDEESTPGFKGYPFTVGERLSYDISWGNFSSVGKSIFEVRQQGTLNGNRVLELFAEVSSAGAARTLINVNDQLSSLVSMDTLLPVKTDLQLREGKRIKQSSVTYDRSKNMMTLSNGLQSKISSSAYDLLSLFYAVRADDLKIGLIHDFTFIDANNRQQQLTFKVIKQEAIGGPLGARDALQIDVIAHKSANPPTTKSSTAKTPEVKTPPAPAQIILAQIWISSDARRLPLYMVTRAPFGELRFQLVNVVNN